jgi:predicted permease
VRFAERAHGAGARLRRLLKRGQFEQDLQDEIAYHLEMRRSNEPVKAPFGNVTSLQETLRETWSFPLEAYWKELSYAARTLRRAPGHTVAIVGMLALGIGVNAATFSLFNALFVRELPVHEPAQLVIINPYRSTADFEDFQKLQTSFSGVAASGSMLGTVVTTESGEQLADAAGALVSGNYFQVLGVQAGRGRVFTQADDRRDDPQAVVVIGDAFWREKLGARADVLGSRLRLSGTLFTIIGVTPPGFTGDMPGRVRDYWVPLSMQPIANPQGDLRRNRSFTWLGMIGRLRPGVSREQAQAEARVVQDQMAADGNETAGRTARPIVLESGKAGFGGIRRSLTTPIRVLGATVAIVLLIVCANVATLLLARGAARTRELAVRQALGCSRGRIVRQLFIEGLLLTLAGGSIGLLLAPLAGRGLLQLQPSFDSIRPDGMLDARVVLFVAGLSLITAAVFSVAPLVRASKTGIEAALRSASRGTTASPSMRRTVRSIVAAQTAFTVVVVASSFLFARSLANLRAVDGGYDRQHIISATVDARFAGYRDDAAQAQLGRRLVERLSAVPGVKSASVGLCAVLMGCSRMGTVDFSGGGSGSIWINPVSANYFETAGMPVVDGRGFGPQDRRGAPPVAVVTESLARYHFPTSRAVGQRFTQRSGPGVPAEDVEIVGVVRDVKFVNPRDPPIRMAFLPAEQHPGPFSYVQVRTSGPPASVVGAVQGAIREVDANLYVRGLEPLSTSLDRILAREVLLSRAGTLFGLVALVLAAFGTFGVISYLVAARKAEISIRLAIGAQPKVMLREVITDALRTVLPGIVAGIGAAWFAARWIETLLFGVGRQSPSTYLLVAGVLLAATAAAAYIPARRAARLDPAGALRCE